MKKAIVAVLAATAALCMTSGVFADDNYMIKMSTQLSEGSPFVEGFNAWAEAVSEKTDGHVTIEVYPSAALGSDEDVIEQALQGANVAVLTDSGRMGNYVKEMGILNAAYFADSYEEMEKFMNTDVVKPHMDESTCFLLPA